ncbi:MYNN protein, partial [Polypterus senegalus]
MPGDGTCLLHSLCYILHGHIRLTLDIRRNIVSYVLNDWDRFKVWTDDGTGDNYATQEHYDSEMLKPFTYGSACFIMQNFHHCKYLLDQLNKQREQSILCDCIVVIGQSHFKAHKNVLAAFSEYFGAQNDSSSIDGFTFLDPSQVNEYKFQTLLDFLYTGVINIDCYNVSELLQAANYLKIESLVARCIEFSETHIESKKHKMEEEATATASVGTGLAGKRSYASSAYNYSKEYASPHAGGDQKGLPKGQLKNGCQKTTRKKINQVQKLAEKSISSYVDLVEKNELKKDLPRSAKVLAYTNHNTEQLTQLNQQCKNLEKDLMGSESLADQDKISQKPNRKRSRAGKKRTPKESCKTAPASIKEERCLDPSVGSELNERQSKRKPLCSACGKVFSEASSLQRHMRIHKGVKPYICQLCGKAFTQCNQLKTHTRTHTGDINQTPHSAPDFFQDEDILQKAVLQELVELKPINFSLANFVPMAPEDKMLLMITEEKAVSNFVNDNETNEQMEDLPVLTEQKEQLTRVTEASSCSNHNRTGLKRRQKEFKSESVDNTSVPSQGVISQNPKRRRSRSGKKRALKSASASAPVAVKRERCLDPSLEIELSERQSKRKPLCSACGKVFSETSSLQRHMRIHKGEKPYICQLCGKAFTQCNQLKTHTRTHTGEKPYKCDICNKGFAQKCQLVFHSHMHHGEEKPYKCDFCSLQFATSSNLKIHTRTSSDVGVTVKIPGNTPIVPVPRVTDSDIVALAQAVNNTFVTGLDLRFNQLTDLGSQHLANLLKRNETLKRLQLTGNKIGNIGAMSLASMLQINNCLEDLDVSDCDVEETTVHMAQMLKMNQHLIELHLGKHDMKDFGVERLSEALTFNFTLRYLDLRWLAITSNNITGKGLVALAEAMKINSSLSYIYIWGNKLDEPTCVAFSEMISCGRLPEEHTDVSPYVVDGQVYLAELSHGLRKHYYWTPSFGPDGDPVANSALALSAGM